MHKISFYINNFNLPKDVINRITVNIKTDDLDDLDREFDIEWKNQDTPYLVIQSYSWYVLNLIGDLLTFDSETPLTVESIQNQLKVKFKAEEKQSFITLGFFR